MADAYRLTLLLHIVAGCIGLAAFWTPALARKGGTLHVRAGRVFYWMTSAVAATGLVMATLLLINPPHPRARLVVPFLYYLLLITFTPVYHGVRVLATRRNPEQLRTRFHTALSLTTIAASTVMVVLGIVARQPLFLFMSPIGFLIGAGNLQFARRPYPTPMAWWYEHMGSMMGGGLAFHTAFLVLGAGRLFGFQIEGPTAIFFWLLPTLIGVPATEIWTRYYRRRFREGSVVVSEPFLNRV
jgi:hypothetical protein